MKIFILKGPKGEIYELFSKSQHTVARDDADITLADDTSVSRQHATINLMIKNKQVIIFVKDHNSKYGTYINDGIKERKKIGSGIPIEIKTNDRIKFGLQWNVWTIKELPLCVCRSGLSYTDKKELENIIYLFNGSIVSEWSDRCTHLTTNNLNLTKKVTCALACMKPIVTVDYWRKLNSVTNFQTEVNFVECNTFFPPFNRKIQQINPVLFQPKSSRKNIFTNITFYAFSNKQYQDVYSLVLSAGGKVYNISQNESISLSHTTSKFVVLVPPKIRENDRFKNFLDNIQSSQLRLIPESEIILAIIFSSADKFCNPFWDPDDDDFDNYKEDAILLKNNIHPDSDEDLEELESQSSNIELAFPSTKRLFEESSDEEDNEILFKTPATGRLRKLQKTNDTEVINVEEKDTFCEVVAKKKTDDNIVRSRNANSSNNTKSAKTIIDDGSNDSVGRNLRSKKKSLFDFSTTSTCPKSSVPLFSSGDYDGYKRKRVHNEQTELEEGETGEFNRTKHNESTSSVNKKLRFASNYDDTEKSELMNKVKQSFMSNYISKMSKLPEIDSRKLSESSLDENEQAATKFTTNNEEHNEKEFSQFVVNAYQPAPPLESNIDELEPEVRDLINKVKIVIKPLVVVRDKDVNYDNYNRVRGETENVKQFRKQQYAGIEEESLPIMIAGSDLYVHRESFSRKTCGMFYDEGSDKEIF